MVAPLFHETEVAPPPSGWKKRCWLRRLAIGNRLYNFVSVVAAGFLLLILKRLVIGFRFPRRQAATFIEAETPRSFLPIY